MKRKYKKSEKITITTRKCLLCYFCTFKERTTEQVNECIENWMDAENCPNWTPVVITVFKFKKIKLEKILNV